MIIVSSVQAKMLLGELPEKVATGKQMIIALTTEIDLSFPIIED